MSEKRIASADFPRLRWAEAKSAAAATAMAELSSGLSAMLSRRLDVAVAPDLAPRRMVVEFGADGASEAPAAALAGDDFTIANTGRAIVIDAASDRAMIHAAARFLELAGARFPACAPPIFPSIEVDALSRIGGVKVSPAFKRRAFISDIMTWHYHDPAILERHLAHDREFISWMGRRGFNAFEFIRHAVDTELRIEPLAGEFDARGIDSEYGGHIIQLLMPRDAFREHPEYFPAAEDGSRIAKGNLCVSNRDAIRIVRDGALRYVRDYPENRLLHVWGADVWDGAWCACGSCRELPPQLQYMEVVNAIADALADDSHAPTVAYLAYHDTLDAHPGLRPAPNVSFEWAPRERCYSHAIDDPACDTNPRYLESLKRHIDIYDGRGHVFEYYADAILFGGLAFATPEIIARDLRCYRALGIDSVSCLTFGAFSALAYPVNLECFARGTRDASFDGIAAMTDCAAMRHRTNESRMPDAYRAVARASRMVLDYADVMRPYKIAPAKRASKSLELVAASALFNQAASAAHAIEDSLLARSERSLWRYSAEVLSGLAKYLDAMTSDGASRAAAGAEAIAQIERAIGYVHEIDAELKGTWGTYDFERFRDIWLFGLRRALESADPAKERDDGF
jgi:hypothetical protein